MNTEYRPQPPRFSLRRVFHRFMEFFIQRRTRQLQKSNLQYMTPDQVEMYEWMRRRARVRILTFLAVVFCLGGALFLAFMAPI